ncbi:hypothetical protein DFH09DRAFT_1386410 [Mycena vulgaris]|nr:hypothetical protein DFH09DRAFT_1386410 [Mycena vulgaris]
MSYAPRIHRVVALSTAALLKCSISIFNCPNGHFDASLPFKPTFLLPMSIQLRRLRPLLPKSPSQARPEPFLINADRYWTSGHSDDIATVTKGNKIAGSETFCQVWVPSSVESSVLHGDVFSPKPGQRMRRDRETKENENKVKPLSHRFQIHESAVFCCLACAAAARTCRQRREIVKTRGVENVPFRAQLLCRRIEEGKRCLEADPDCDRYRALDLEYELSHDKLAYSHRTTVTAHKAGKSQPKVENERRVQCCYDM